MSTTTKQQTSEQAEHSARAQEARQAQERALRQADEADRAGDTVGARCFLLVAHAAEEGARWHEFSVKWGVPA